MLITIFVLLNYICNFVVMHLVENTSSYKSKNKKKIYNSILLRESYREGGKVKKRTIANLSHCNAKEIASIKLALKYKDDLSVLGSLKESVQLQEGSSIGAVWTIYNIAKELGIDQALGNSFQGKLALWQVIARVIDQGSRLSAVRLAMSHACCDILDFSRGFDENDLYSNLSWLSDNQVSIENRLFHNRKNKNEPQLFLYDVTSSYLEGQKNYFGEYGYNRDGKKGKKQIVIGLLCDDEGGPVSTEVFSGNTQDINTFASQVIKVTERFGCKRATFVGDRGMIKNAQIKKIPEGFHYITAITKPQITSLINEGVIKMELFDDDVCEIEEKTTRYILRRNPFRAIEMANTRKSKLLKVEKLIEEKNCYLKEHTRAKGTTAITKIEKKIVQFKIDKWLKVQIKDRQLILEKEEPALKETTLLDGCYVIKTDLTNKEADKQMVHDRYKDLTQVERAFRDCKTVTLETRPIYVRKSKSTMAHVLVVMLAYMIVRRLRKGWKDIDVTVAEGINQLSSLCSMEIIVKGNGSCLRIPKPREDTKKLLDALNIKLPDVLPHHKVNVVTRKKLMAQRKDTEKSRVLSG